MCSCAHDVRVADAQDLILAGAEPLGTEQRALSEAGGCWLAEDILADRDYPPFDRARMDGFAVRADDVPHAPRELAIVGQTGADWTVAESVAAGQASRINVGARMPVGADTVVLIEQTIVSEDGRRVTILEAPRPNQYTEKRASIQSAGKRVMKKRSFLGPAHLAVAATAGAASVDVYRRPTVSIVVIGNEPCVEDGQPGAPDLGRIGLVSLRLSAEAVGCRVDGAYHVEAGAEPVQEAIRRGLSADVLILSGGVFAGPVDLVPKLLSESDVDAVFQRVRLRPGREVQYGRAHGGRHVFALPGDQIGCFVCFWLFIRPLLLRLSGAESCQPATLSGRATGTVPAAGDRETYWPAAARSRAGGSVWADPLPWHGSGDPFPFGRANALIRMEAHGREVRRGESVTLLPLELLPTSLSPGDSGPRGTGYSLAERSEDT